MAQSGMSQSKRVPGSPPKRDAMVSPPKRDAMVDVNQRLDSLEKIVQQNHEATTKKLDTLAELLSKMISNTGPLGGFLDLRSNVRESRQSQEDSNVGAEESSSGSSRPNQESFSNPDDLESVADEPFPVLVESSVGMINPKNTFRRCWDLCLILPILVYLMVVSPFRLCFANEAVVYTDIFWFEFAVDLVFITDILLNFRTGILVENPVKGEGMEFVEYDRWRVAFSYGTSWFTIDVASGVPFTLLELIAAKIGGGASSNKLAALKGMKNLKLLRFLKLGRILKIDKIISNLDRDTNDKIEDFLQNGTTRATFTSIKLLFFLMYTTHLFACGFVLVGRAGSDAGVDSWFDHEIKGPYTSEDTTGVNGVTAVFSIYVAAFYFIITTITSVGYGDIITRNNTERVYVIALELVGALVFAAVIGFISSVVTSMDMNAQKKAEKLDAVAAFVTIRKFPEILGRRIRRHFRHFYRIKSAIDETRIFSDLSTSLRKEVSQFLVSELMGDRSFFTKLPTTLWPKILPLLRPMSFEGDEIVCVQGEACSEMLVLLTGTMIGVTKVGGESLPRKRHITAGDSINVLRVLSIWSECVETITAKSVCQSYAISSDDFASLFQSDADKATFAKLQVKEVGNYKMNENYPGAPTAAGKPLHFSCFSLVEISLSRVAGSTRSSGPKIKSPRRSGSFQIQGLLSDSSNTEIWMIVDLIDDATAAPFNDYWRFKTNKISVPRENITAAAWSDVIRWTDVSVPVDQASIRVRLYESDAGCLGHALVKLPSVESPNAATFAGILPDSFPVAAHVDIKPVYLLPPRSKSVEAWFLMTNHGVKSARVWSHLRFNVKRPENSRHSKDLGSQELSAASEVNDGQRIRKKASSRNAIIPSKATSRYI